MADYLIEPADGEDAEQEEDILELVRKRLIQIGDQNDEVADQYNRQRVNVFHEISGQLSRIGDGLDTSDRNELVRLLREHVSASAASGGLYALFALSIRKFMTLVEDKRRLSGETVQSIIRLFLQLWNDRSLSNAISKVINEDELDDVPCEINNMDSEFVTLYHQALSEGHHYVKDIRLMIVGMFGVGKTSLLRNIVDESEDTADRYCSPESTVGIDVTHCEVLKDGSWRKIFDNNYANEKLSNIIIQLRDHTNLAGFAEPLPSDSEYTTHPSLSRQDGKCTVSCQSGYVASASGHSNFKKRLLSVDNFETFMNSVMEMMANTNASSISEKRVAVWDFAGQNIYYSTHHFFLNGRSIYLLLMYVSKPLNSSVVEIKDFPISGFIHKNFTCLEAFKFWLRSIYMYHSMQISDTSVKPSVILVGTHKDKLVGNDQKKEQLKEDVFNEALKSFMGSPILKLVKRKKFLVNNLDNKEDYESIRLEVQKTAEEQKYWNEKRPAKWIPLERSLEGLKAEGKEIISFDELKKEDLKNEMPLNNESDLKLFLQFQHSLGNVLYYETELLKQCIILSPQWIIDAFRCFISHMPDKDPEQLHLWNDYEQRAILTDELIDEIIDNNPTNECFRDYKKEIVKYMELLDMIAKPMDVVDHGELLEEFPHGDSQFDENFSEHATNTSYAQRKAGNGFGNASSNLQNKKDFYIVPILLRSRPEEEQMSKWLNPPLAKNKTPILAMVFKDGFLPPSVFHRLLAICIRQWPVQKICGQFLLYNGFGRFCVTKSTTLTIWYQDHIVYGRVCCYTDVTDMKRVCVDARHFLSNSLKSILSILPNKGGIREVLPFDEYIQCGHITAFKPGMGLIRLRDFLYHDSIMCEDCEGEHVMSRKEGLGLWCDDLLQQQNLVNSTLAKDVLCRCLTPTELVHTAISCVGDEYFRLGLELGVSDKRLEQIRDVDKYHAPTRIYHMLCEAKRVKERDNTDDSLTVEVLRNGMIAVGADVSLYDNLFEKRANETGTIDGTVNNANVSLSENQLARLAECIGDEYWLLGIILGIPEITMQQLRDKYKQPPVRNNNILLEWVDRDNNATIRTLLSGMQLVGSDYQKAETICLT